MNACDSSCHDHPHQHNRVSSPQPREKSSARALVGRCGVLPTCAVAGNLDTRGDDSSRVSRRPSLPHSVLATEPGRLSSLVNAALLGVECIVMPEPDD